MNPIVVLLSDCCNSPIRYGNSPHEGKTNYHVCTKCNNACNLAPPPLHPEITDADLGDNMLSAWNEPNGVQACIDVAIEYAQAFHYQQLKKSSQKTNKIQIISKLKEAFLDKNLECDGAGCIGCWKDIVRQSIKMLEESIMPSQEEIEQRKLLIDFTKSVEFRYITNLWMPISEAVDKYLEKNKK